MEITLHLRFAFVGHSDVFVLRYNYVIYLFDAIMFFDAVRFTLFFGTFELSTETTL